MKKNIGILTTLMVLLVCVFALAACNQPKTYTVTYDSDGGSKVDAVTQNQGTEFKAPTDPTKPGYKFAGWFSDKDLKNKVDFPFKPEKSCTLYAKWEAQAETKGLDFKATSDDKGLSVSKGTASDADVVILSEHDGKAVIEIGSFADYKGLKSIVIPESITSIEKDAFKGYGKDLTIYFNGTEKAWKEISKDAAIPADVKVVFAK